MATDPTLTQRLVTELDAYEAIRLAVLFGSAARGEARADSDLDLGILLADDAPGDLLMRIEGAVGMTLRSDVDTIDLRRAPPLLRFEIARDGQLLLEREDGTWTDFKTRAMLDWWDWQPTFHLMTRVARERLRKEAGRGSS